MGSNSRSFLDLEQQCYSIITLPSANIRESSRILAMISSTSGRRGSSNVCSLTQNEGSGEVISSISAKKADPSDDQRWDTIFAVCFGIALFLDPLFFYMFVIDNNSKCIDSDKAWKITMCAIRSCIDFIYILHVIRKSCNGYYRNATSSRLICLNPSFILDVLSALPVPQVVIFIIAPQVNAPISSFLRNPLVVGLIPHYINRIINAGKFYLKLPNGSRIFRPASFTGLAFGVFVCVVTINGFGALWYFYTIMRVDACWRISCAKNNCNPDTLKCGAVRVGDYSFLNSSCHFLEPNEMKEPTDFDFGIVLEALQSKVAENRNILQKYIYCNWWSLRNLSSLGESLRTSSYILDNVFAIFISFYGLCLFIFLIQIYVQSLGSKIETMMQGEIEKPEQCTSKSPEDPTICNKIQIITYTTIYISQETKDFRGNFSAENSPEERNREMNGHFSSLMSAMPTSMRRDDQQEYRLLITSVERRNSTTILVAFVYVSKFAITISAKSTLRHRRSCSLQQTNSPQPDCIAES